MSEQSLYEELIEARQCHQETLLRAQAAERDAATARAESRSEVLRRVAAEERADDWVEKTRAAEKRCGALRIKVNELSAKGNVLGKPHARADTLAAEVDELREKVGMLGEEIMKAVTCLEALVGYHCLPSKGESKLLGLVGLVKLKYEQAIEDRAAIHKSFGVCPHCIKAMTYCSCGKTP